MNSLFRRFLAGSVALMTAGAVLAADIPTGVIADAQHAVVDGAVASLGSNIYSGDSLSTYENGQLRFRVGSGQVFMLASTDAALTQDHALMDVLLRRGTAGFSATAADPLELETPVGTVRPKSDARSFGQVTILNDQHQVLITAYEGDLLLSRNGESKTIAAGESYRVALAAAAGAAGAAAAAQPALGPDHHQWVFEAVVITAAAVTAYLVWRKLCESPSTPRNAGAGF
jgi:hypothetical protein